MIYLHRRDIIHRDLKSSNGMYECFLILLDVSVPHMYMYLAVVCIHEMYQLSFTSHISFLPCSCSYI